MKKFLIDEDSLTPEETPRFALEVGDIEYHFHKARPDSEEAKDKFHATYTEHGHGVSIVLTEQTKNHWSVKMTHFGAYEQELIHMGKNKNGLLIEVKQVVIDILNKYREEW